MQAEIGKEPKPFTNSDTLCETADWLIWIHSKQNYQDQEKPHAKCTQAYIAAYVGPQ